MRALPVLTLLLSGWFTVSAQADEALDWLDRLARAEQQQSYQGTFVYERKGSFSTHRIWHLIRDGKVSERLLQLDGSAQEVVRFDGHTQCISGSLIAGLGEVQDSSARSFDGRKLGAWYQISVEGESRVAGRKAVIVALRPRDQHRYGFELHLDRETGLPLKSLLLDDKGQLLERFQFAEFDTSIPQDENLQASAQCKPVLANDKARAGKASAAWHSEWLPAGFVLSGSSVRLDPRTKSQVSSLMYDDGLARFSVFLEPLNGARVMDTRTQQGPTAAVSRRLSTPAGDVLVTVVGEVPIGTAERIALSMRADDVPAKQ